MIQKSKIKNRASSFFKKLSVFAAISATAVFISGTSISASLPQSYYSYKGNISTQTNFPVSIRCTDSTGESHAQAFLLNTIPIKYVDIKSQGVKKVVPCGTPIGVKMYCEGAVVVDTQEIGINGTNVCPAKEAGIKKGDLIKKVGNRPISNNFELINAVNESNGEELSLTIERDEKERIIKLKPVKTGNNGEYKIGVWVRDSSAGIGTVTFYDPDSGAFASLGHGVCDIDTGELVPMSNGIPVRAEIDSVMKSTKGAVGCLQGHFIDDLSESKVYANTVCGLYGTLKESPCANKEIEIASSNEVKTGSAQILSTIHGTSPKYYDIEIIEISNDSSARTKNFVIKATDKELIEKTGGIVQGMSGSPIIQGGKLVGAVTHVFVNDPIKGYAIFAETMLEEMNRQCTVDSELDKAW